MRKIHFVLYILFLLSVCKSYAQEIPKEKLESKRLENLSAKMEGTYQLQIVNSRYNVVFPTSLLDEVEAKRDENDTVLFWISSEARIVILPKKIINKYGFKKLSPLVIHTN